MRDTTPATNSVPSPSVQQPLSAVLPQPEGFKLSIIVPTYHEAENIQELSKRVFRTVRRMGFDTEMLIVDDDSNDGTAQLCHELSKIYALRLITRKKERGLATAVLHGIRQAAGDIIIVMDADLSHPPEEIPHFVRQILTGGADFVVGSRYVKGGSTDAAWGLFRWLNSKVATLLARGLTTIQDPMAGYFAFPRHILHSAPQFSPVGYKIGLEILTKARCQHVVEIPIAFADRKRGTSKLTWREQILYLRHLRRLYRFQYSQTAELLQFGVVGLSGVVVDLTFFLVLLYLVDVHHQTARAVSFVLAASWNWFFNRWFTFVGGHAKHPARQWIEFVLTALCGFAINWGSYKFLTDHVPYMALHKLIPFGVGICLGSGFNYMLCRLLVFRAFEERIAGKEAPVTREDIR